MNSKRFNIITLSKKFLFGIDDIICRFPNKEKILKDKLKIIGYEIIELVYESNYLPLDSYKNERIVLQSKILSKISIINLLLEESYKKGYITESLFSDKCNILLELDKSIRGWIVYEKSY